MSSATSGSVDELAVALGSIETEAGANLLSLVAESPVLLIFLRHFGCSFCRQAISDVAGLQAELASRQVRPVFVHLGPPDLAKVYFEHYGIGDVERVNDPDASIYKLPVFGLGRKNPLAQALNPLGDSA